MEVNFPFEGYSYNVFLQFFRSETAKNEGKASFTPVGVNQNVKKELTLEEYSGLTPTIIHTQVMAELENYVGEGNVQIVL
jgi:hypothetical protein